MTLLTGVKNEIYRNKVRLTGDFVAKQDKNLHGYDWRPACCIYQNDEEKSGRAKQTEPGKEEINEER